jgi:hypothetical protein
MTPLLYILGTALAIAFILFGWDGEGILHKASLIIGGVYFGHILTEALNYVENVTTDNTTEGA